MYFYIQPYIIYNSFILICCSCVICVHFFSDSTQQRECIVHITQSLLQRFKLEANENTVVYHHWYDLNTGKRIIEEGTGATKTCPGTNFFGGNTVAAFKAGLLPLLKMRTKEIRL